MTIVRGRRQQTSARRNDPSIDVVQNVLFGRHALATVTSAVFTPSPPRGQATQVSYRAHKTPLPNAPLTLLPPAAKGKVTTGKQRLASAHFRSRVPNLNGSPPLECGMLEYASLYTHTRARAQTHTHTHTHTRTHTHKQTHIHTHVCTCPIGLRRGWGGSHDNMATEIERQCRTMER